MFNIGTDNKTDITFTVQIADGDFEVYGNNILLFYVDGEDGTLNRLTINTYEQSCLTGLTFDNEHRISLY